MNSSSQTIRRRPHGRRTFSEDETLPAAGKPGLTSTSTIASTSNASTSNTISMSSFSQLNPSPKNLVNEIPQKDLLMTPVLMTPAGTDETRAMDDSFIRRLSLGAYADLENNNNANVSSRTTPRRPANTTENGGKYYLCPSNTFVASNGEVYHVDPFQLPPPSEIAKLFQEINQRRVNGKHSPRSVPSSSPVSSVCSSPSRFQANGGDRGKVKAEKGNDTDNDRDSRATVNQKYPSLPSEWMRTPRSSLQDINKLKRSPPRRRVSSPDKQDNKGEHEEEDEEEDEDEDEEEHFNFKKFSWRKFILAEMLGIGQPAGPVEPIAAESIDNFLSVPYKLECLIMFGCFVALDSFLYVITYLPIRFCFAIYIFLDELVLPHQMKLKQVQQTGMGVGELGGWNWSFPRNRLYDFMRGLLLIIGCFALSLVDMSRVYHYVRMQNTLKLYALTGMMEIIDKLLCSFGIDVLDSLFVKSRSNKNGSGAIFTFIVAAVYVVIHSSLYFLHMTTLTVAINNQDQSLLTVLILNNFAEIKSSVLKKFDSGNLFQLACSDISERFKMLLFYTLIIAVGLAQSPNMSESFWSFAYILLAMVCCEMVVDWIKHAFIAKFNSIKSICYIDYSRALRNDILNGHNDKITLDHSYTITKRLGMSQIPLGVVFFKFLSIGMSSSRITALMSSMSMGQLLCWFLVFFLFVLVFKVVLAVGLIYYTAKMNSKEKKVEKLEEKKRKQQQIQTAMATDTARAHIASSCDDATPDPSTTASVSTDSILADRKQSVEALSNIERYTMLRGRINA